MAGSSAAVPSTREMERDVASCAASHASLVAFLEGGADVDPQTPTSLPGWTVGHVLTHIARNGDSHVAMLAGHPQYPSVDARNADIDRGAARSWDVLVADVRRASDAVDAAFAAVDDWSGAVRTLAGERPCSMLPLLRQREVEVHRVDLGLGYGFDDLPGDYVRRELRVLEMLWTARQPMGLAKLPEAARAVRPSERLAWLTGRADIADLGPAGLF